MIGDCVSHYRIVAKLGSGGMGVVYEAEDTTLARRVALKFLPEDLARDAAMLERFQREARASSALNHPGICTIHAIDQHEGRHFIAMELLEGQTLAEILKQSPLELDLAVNVAIQLADALESAHAKGIVHRDIKPANIFINARGQAKILDFGLAKISGGRGGEAASEVTAVRGDELTMAGTTLGTISYMSPEQARAQLTDSRTDIFSLGTVVYQMVTGALPFKGESSAVIFEAILNRDPLPANQMNPRVPAELNRILEKALEKDRNLRYQTATDLKTDLLRLRRDLESGARRTAEGSDPRVSGSRSPEQTVAVLYFENLSGIREDEYFRDGITEDIITELSKIRGLGIFSRATVLTYRDRQVTPAQIGHQINASYVLTGSVRRSGQRLRINAQLIDTHTDFPIWSERYDREMKDVFEVQDEIATKIAEALRITLTPQEQEALAAKPTEDLQAYDLYLRGRNYARRLSRQDLQFALQMFENAVSLDPTFALAHAAIANVCAQYHFQFERSQSWIDRAIAATARASAQGKDLPEVHVAEAWVSYVAGRYDEAVDRVRIAIRRKPDTEGAYFLHASALFSAGRYQELAEMAEEAFAHVGEDYNVYVPVRNALLVLGKQEAVRNLTQREIQIFQSHLKNVPEDARARTLLALDYLMLDRPEDALREAKLATALRPDDAMVLYNVACIFASLRLKTEALETLKKAWDGGFHDTNWARRDPDLANLHDEPEFQRFLEATERPHQA